MLENDYPLVTLDLNGNQIGPDGVRAIMRGIKDNVFIESLLFPFVTMGDAGAKALAKVNPNSCVIHACSSHNNKPAN
jgi:hypothetical protein